MSSYRDVHESELRDALRSAPAGFMGLDAPPWLQRLGRAACRLAGIQMSEISDRDGWVATQGSVTDDHGCPVACTCTNGCERRLLRSQEFRAAIADAVAEALPKPDARIGKLCRVLNYRGRVMRVVAVERGVLLCRDDAWPPDYADYRANPDGVEWVDEDSPSPDVEPPLNAELAAAGFHRIGRIDAVGRRSLWLREEKDAIELRAGREGSDAAVRIAKAHPLYNDLVSVFAAARFAAEWEDPQGHALDPSFALDQCEASINRVRLPDGQD
jgi:hypothetical protein